MTVVRIGTRGSKLALVQAAEVKQLIEAQLATASGSGATRLGSLGTTADVIVVKTSGDEFGPVATASGSGATALVGPDTKEVGLPSVKGMFVKELEEALLDGRVDLAVHSAKDLPTELIPALALGAVLPRRDPRDAVVTRDGQPLTQLSPGARIGASSLRRQAQLKRLCRDAEVLPIRGNVDTRLRKLDEGQYDAIILAACGLERLGFDARIAERLATRDMLPAPGQGALAIEVRADREDLRPLCAALDDAASRQAVSAERALLRSLGGGCQVPIGALATIDASGNLTLEGAVFSVDGLRAIRQTLTGPRQDAERIGITLASHLRAKGADRILFGQKASTWQQRTAPSTS